MIIISLLLIIIINSIYLLLLIKFNYYNNHKQHYYSYFFQNGFVECETESCPAIDDCYILVKKATGGCCDKCKGKHTNI